MRRNEIPTNHAWELYTIYNPAARTATDWNADRSCQYKIDLLNSKVITLVDPSHQHHLVLTLHVHLKHVVPTLC